MKAAQLYGYKQDYVIEEVPDPVPGPGEVVVKVLGSGVCHSDLHFWDGSMAILPLPPFPWILGHENAGYVHALGPGASGFEVGEPVAVFGGWGCGTCKFCLGGEEQLCNVMLWSGLGVPGGYAEYINVPSTRHLVPIGGLDPVLAAPLTDACLTPYRAVKKVLPALVPGSVALIFGVGGLGHLGLQLLKKLTPAKVIVVDPLEQKRKLAIELGADLVIDPTSKNVVLEARQFTNGEGAEGVLDFVGSDSTMSSAMGSVARRGKVVIVGLAGGSAPVSFYSSSPEAEVTSSYWGSRNELVEVVALAQSGAIDVRIEKHHLSNINEVFARLQRGEIDGRAVLMPNE
ncbi:MAG: NAD(P)-dependent alcohol dehydrogenase [Acidimicrobiales bacterium]|nr:NAD(P)-dependent alcohol dehydrogenase [Acidimicrobiales bacterium]